MASDLENMAAMNRAYQDLAKPGLRPLPEESLGTQYQNWAERHPYASTALELGGQYALSKIPYGKYLRSIGLDQIGAILDKSSELLDPYSLHGTTQYIKDPKLRFGKIKDITDPEYKLGNSKDYHIPIEDRQTGDQLGHLSLHVDHSGKHSYIGYLSGQGGFPEGIGPGHLIHIKDELLDQLPDLEDVTFARVSGARLKSGASVISRTMPLRKGGPKSYWHGDPTEHIGIPESVPPEDTAEAERIANMISGRAQTAEPGYQGSLGRRASRADRDVFRSGGDTTYTPVPVHAREWLAWFRGVPESEVGDETNWSPGERVAYDYDMRNSLGPVGPRPRSPAEAGYRAGLQSREGFEPVPSEARRWLAYFRGTGAGDITEQTNWSRAEREAYNAEHSNPQRYMTQEEQTQADLDALVQQRTGNRPIR